MGLVADATQQVEVPHEDGEWFLFRKLSWKTLEEARQLATESAREEAKAWGAEFIQAFRSQDPDDRQAAQDALDARRYHVTQFDREALLVSGIAGWSYEPDVEPETIGQLDEQTAVWAAEQVIAMTRPESEEDRKNG